MEIPLCQNFQKFSKIIKNPNFRTDFGTEINQIFKLKFVFTRLSILIVILSNNLRKSGAPLSLSLTNGSLLRNDIIVNSVFSPESAHTQYCFHIWSHLCFTCSILKLKSQITWCHFIPLREVSNFSAKSLRRRFVMWWHMHETQILVHFRDIYFLSFSLRNPHHVTNSNFSALSNCKKLKF